MQFLLSILSSLSASFIFIFLLLFLLRPRVKISPDLCYQKDIYDGDGRMCYLIKVVNLSRFSAYDINAELSSLITYPVKDGTNYRFTKLKLKSDKLNFIAPFRKKKNYGDFAFLFRTYEDVNAILNDERNSLQFQVTLRHGLTGLSRVFNMDYALCSSIKEGHFSFGNNLNIV